MAREYTSHASEGVTSANGLGFGRPRPEGALSLLRIIREPIPRAELASLAEQQFGNLVKAVVDVARQVIAIGSELHSDEEAALLDDGSKQEHLWGINLYPDEPRTEWLEFDSMINVRPSRGNRSREVEDPTLRESIRRIVDMLITE